MAWPDPTEPGESVATHISPVVERDPSIATLASLAPGRRADPDATGGAWVVSDFAYEDD